MSLAGGPSPPQLSPGEGGVTGAPGAGRLSPGRLKGMETYTHTHTHFKAHPCGCAHGYLDTLRETERPLRVSPAASGRGRRPDGQGGPSDSSRRGGRKGRGGELGAHGCRCSFASAQMGLPGQSEAPEPDRIRPHGGASRWEGVSEAPLVTPSDAGLSPKLLLPLLAHLQ